MAQWSMNNFQLRDARASDRDAIQTITLSAYEQYAPMMGEAWQFYRANILDTLAHVQVIQQIVAENGNGIVGSVLLFPAGFEFQIPNGQTIRFALPEIRLLAVTPNARGQGIGQSLAQECIRRARDAGARAIALHTSDMMQVAMRMYERLGFARDPARDFSPGGGHLVKAYRFELAQVD